jgi:hypothetical protein
MKCSCCEEGGRYEQIEGMRMLVCPYSPENSAYLLDRDDDECLIPESIRNEAHRLLQVELEKMVGGRRYPMGA